MNKIALIYGNGAYPESSLKNSVNDATAITEKLTKLGFRCIPAIDAKINEMNKGLANFADKLKDSDVALFFFAGHGMQIDGMNYLTAVDTQFDNETDVKYSSLPLNKVIEIMEDGRNQTSIIILDACRNNPYERKWRGGEARGLAPVYAPKGMIVAYATSPGQVAYDGTGENSPYTHALLQHISTQDIAIEDFFKRVRNTLSSSTKGKQISWEHTSLMGDFYFNYSATDDLITEYSVEAFADESFRLSADPLHNVIKLLQSHVWDKQNLSVPKLKTLDLSKCGKDDLFVLGRNIYQAACGGAFTVIDFLNDIDRYFSKIEGKTVFHILNGMLYEIYFDRRGRKRELAKLDMIDSVFSLEENVAYTTSFDFIRQALKPYLKELFYIPGKGKDVCVNITTLKMPDGKIAISELFYEGDNILYDAKGQSYYDPLKDNFLTIQTKEEICKSLSQGLVTPTYRLKLHYVDFDEAPVSLLFPFRPNIMRFSK